MYQLEKMVLIFNIILICIMCYMCVNYSMWWILLLALCNSVDNKKVGD